MAIEMVSLEWIEDNPYQSRQVYHKKDIDELAESIRTHGLLQVPLARRKDGGRVELAFGQLRKRAYIKLAKEDPEKWGKMPLDIHEFRDEEMALFSLEENLKRHDITPIEVARAVEKFLEGFPEMTEEQLAKQLDMTQGNISHMRRVLRLPEEVLEKINEGRINFTMGRELLVFQDLEPPKAKNLMLEAIRGLKTESRAYGQPNTVEGLQKSIHDVARNHLRPLEKEFTWYSREPLFDTRAAGCLQCQHMVRTHPTKSQVAHWCTNQECWERKQQEHKDGMAAAAKAKMAADVLRKVAAVEEKRREGADITQVIIEAEQPAEGLLAVEEVALVEEGIVAADEEERARIEHVKRLPPEYPCHGCLNIKRCDFTTVVALDDGTFSCENRLTKETIAEVKERATVVIPEELRPLIEEKAGTRAEILDLRELRLGGYGWELKQGYARLRDELDRIADPEECLERCTHGFHYGFDSDRTTGEAEYVCSNPKCLSKKKAAFTRAKNAEGQAKKKAEMAAIKRAVQETTVLDRPRMKLIILVQMEGRHTGSYFYGEKSPRAWLNEKLGVRSDERNSNKVIEALDLLSDEPMAKLVVEFMLEMMRYTGDVERYRIQTTEALNWMGIGVTVPGEPTS